MHKMFVCLCKTQKSRNEHKLTTRRHRRSAERRSWKMDKQPKNNEQQTNKPKKRNHIQIHAHFLCFFFFLCILDSLRWHAYAISLHFLFFLYLIIIIVFVGRMFAFNLLCIYVVVLLCTMWWRTGYGLWTAMCLSMSVCLVFRGQHVVFPIFIHFYSKKKNEIKRQSVNHIEHSYSNRNLSSV